MNSNSPFAIFKAIVFRFFSPCSSWLLSTLPITCALVYLKRKIHNKIVPKKKQWGQGCGEITRLWSSFPELKAIRQKRLLVLLWCAGMAQWWEHSPPTNVAWVRFPDSASYVGWVCWFFTLYREVFSGYSDFPSRQKPKFDLIFIVSPISALRR